MKQAILKMCGAYALIAIILIWSQILFGKAGVHAVLFAGGLVALMVLLYQVARGLHAVTLRRQALKRRRGRHAKR